jgi:hypothetical protein
MALVGSVFDMRFPPDCKWWRGNVLKHDTSDDTYLIHFKEDDEQLWFELNEERGKAREVLQGGCLGPAQPCRLVDPTPEAVSLAVARSEPQRAPTAASAPGRVTLTSAREPTASKQQRKRAAIPSSRPATADRSAISPDPSGVASDETKRPRRAAASKAMALVAASSESDFESSADELDEQAKARRCARGKRGAVGKGASGRARNAKKRAAQPSDDDDDEDEEWEEEEDDGDDDEDYEDEDEEDRPRRGTAKAKSTAKGKAKAMKEAAGSKVGDARSMTKEDRAAELVELQAIWANPPPQKLKVR